MKHVKLFLVGLLITLATTTTHAIDTSKAVGEIPIQSGVSPLGARTYTVPIDVYPGIGGHTPQVALSYNSMQGNGTVGVGWGISGLSTISRVNKTIYYDGKTSGIALNSDDSFVLDGQHLIRLDDEDDTPCYQTEQGNIKVKATLSGTDITGFTVFYPDGRIGIYSSMDTGRLTYPLMSLTNIDGHVITYTYTCTNNVHYIQSITYNTYAKIEFTYESRPDDITSYANGHKHISDKRLKKISCKWDITSLGDYTLSYTTLNELSMLVQIDFSRGSSSLNPLVFSYGEDSKANNYSTKSISLNRSFTIDEPEHNQYLRFIKGKFEYFLSDGVLFLPNRNSFKFSENSNTASNRTVKNEYDDYSSDVIVIAPDLEHQQSIVQTLPIGANFVDVLCADLSGEQQDYIVRINNSNTNGKDRLSFSIYRYTTTYGVKLLYNRYYDIGNVFYNSEGTSNIHPKTFQVGDFNGDGRQDIMVLVEPVTAYDQSIPATCLIYDLERNKLLYSGTPFTYAPQRATVDGKSFKEMSDTERMLICDYNGDGKSDICLINSTGVSIYEFNTTGSNITACVLAQKSGLLSQNNLVNHELFAGEFNGDGLIDLLITPKRNNSDTQWAICYSKGNGLFESTTFTGPTFGTEAYDGFITQDVNGDGKTDLIKYTKDSFSTYLTIGNVIFPSVICTSFISEYSAIVPTSITSHNYFSQVLTLKDNILTQYSFQNDIAKQRVLTSFTNSMGNIEHSIYKLPNDDEPCYFAESSYYAEFPFVILRERIPLISSSYKDIEGTIQDEQNFVYTNLTMHRQGLGVCGMERIVTTGEQNYKVQEFNPTKHSILLYEENKTGNSTYNYEIKYPNNDPIVLLNLIKKSMNDNLNGFSSVTTYGYNEYGFPITEETTTSDSIISSSNLSVEHYNTSTKYLLNIVKEKTTTTTRDGLSHTKKITYPSLYYNKPLKQYHYVNGNQVSYETFTYNSSNGLLSQKTIQHYSSPNTLTTSYQYDEYGHLTKETTPEQLTKEYAYDAYGRVYKYTNELGVYDVYVYDDLHRKIRTNYANGSWESTQYSWKQGTPFKTHGYIVTTEHSNGRKSATYYDTKHQEIRSVSNTAFEYDLVKNRTYDTYGRMLTESVPVTENSSLQHTYQYVYDDYDRLTSVTAPTGKKTTYAYNKNQTTTVEDGITTIRTMDSQGNMISVKDSTGTITYLYRPDGQLLSATLPTRRKVTTEYDDFGRQTKLSDPCSGTTTFTYDEAGNMASKTDGTGKQTLMEYDAYGRLTRQEYVGTLSTTYTYNNKGQLTGEYDSNGAVRLYEYDNTGRVWWEYQSVNETDDHNLSKYYGYLTNGNLDFIEYSQDDGENSMFYGLERYEYHNGQIKRITFDESIMGDEFEIWHNQSCDEFGLTNIATSGNLTHNYTHDNLLRPVYMQTTDNNSGNTLREINYHYQKNTGNLIGREEVHKGMSEAFTYDHMNRLTDDGPITYEYDEQTGNMIYNSRVGNFGATNSFLPDYRIAVIDHYVLGGNMSCDYISTDQQAVTYNAMSRPTKITENTHNLEFTYNGRGERIKSYFYTKETPNPLVGAITTDIETRYYLGNIYERHIKQDGEHRVILYLGGDAYSAPAAFVMDDEYGPHIAYILRDRQGSITHLISDKYQKEYSYDAWGNLRDPESYEIYIPRTTTNELYLGRGYTGHEHHGYFGLINMNARLYDPIMCRFLSPDPFVQMPDNSQNFNRYLYCMNNPLKYTDESGEWFGIDDLISAVGGFVIGYLSHGISSGNWGWDAVESGLGGSLSSWLAFNTVGTSTAMSGLKFVGNSALNTTLSYLTPSIGVSVGNFSVSANPVAMFTGGVAKGSIFSFGAGVSASYSIGDFYLSGGISTTSQGGRLSYGGGYNDGTFGASWFGSSYLGSDAQRTGTIKLNAGDWSIAHENDLDKMLGDGGDRYRTAAIEIGYKDYILGANVYTNDAKSENYDPYYNSEIWGANTKGAYMNSQVYQSPVYIGTKHQNMMFRVGVNTPVVQDLTQNFIHKLGNWGYYKTPYGKYRSPYYQFGTYNSFSLY